MDERRQDYPDILSKIAEVNTDVKDIKKLLLGNGKVGLIEKVRSHDGYISSQKRYAGIAMSAFIVGIIGVVITFFVFKLGIPH